MVARHKCVLIDGEKKPVYKVNPEVCIGCGVCLQSGCPALRKQDGKVSIEPTMCKGCNLGAHLCPTGAIEGGR